MRYWSPGPPDLTVCSVLPSPQRRQFCIRGVRVLWQFISVCSHLLPCSCQPPSMTGIIFPILQVMKPRLRRTSDHPKVALPGSGRIRTRPQPEFKSHVSSCCHDSHAQMRKPGVFLAELVEDEEGKKEEEGGERRKERKKNTPNLFICFHFI